MQTKTAKTLNINLNKPHINQEKILKSKARFRVVPCGRRFGKSECAKIIANIRLLKQGQHIWFCSPTNKNSKRMFRQFVNLYKGFPEDVIKINKTDMRIDFLFNGGWIEFISLAEPDNLRGEGLDFVVIDEAGFVQDHVWDEIISPMLLTTKGDALFISSTNGRNWFWRLYQLGLDKNEPDYESFMFTTYDNPLIDKEEIDKIRKTTPSYVFDREYMAIFEEDGGSVFKNTTGCTRQYDYSLNDDPLLTKEDYERLCEEKYLEDILLGDSSTIVMGVDWGQMNDYTVVTVFDVERNSLLEFERINQTDWETIRQVIIDLHDKWQPLLILAEENNATANIETLQKEGYPVEGFKTTSKSKPIIINKLALEIEQNNLSIPNDKTLLGELNAYSMTQSAFGNIKYGAPSGLHDDIVMSFAICLAGAEMVLIPEAFTVISV